MSSIMNITYTFVKRKYPSILDGDSIKSKSVPIISLMYLDPFRLGLYLKTLSILNEGKMKIL